jgi:DNA-binding MarR family transcriptional regulator
MSKRSPVPKSETASDLAAQVRTVLSRLKRRLREYGAREDLTPSQISALLRLEKDGAATVSGLARAEGMRPQSMSSIVTSLQDAGLVSSSSDPNDGRKTLMSLNKKCDKLLRETRAARQDWLTTTILQKLSAQERQQLSTTLELLNRLTEDGPLRERWLQPPKSHPRRRTECQSQQSMIKQH